MAPEVLNVMDNCKQKLIAGYELSHLDLDSSSVEDVSQLILEVMQSALASSDSDPFSSAAGLFNDLVVVRPNRSEIEIRFRESYEAGEQRAIVKQLESAMEHSLFGIRWNSISMLGRSGAVESIGKMVESFDRKLESDPAILPRLVAEIRWLIGCAERPDRFEGVYRGLLERLVHSDSYMNRWAAVEIIQQSPDSEPSVLVEQLKADVHPVVRLQARSPGKARVQRVNFESVFIDYPNFPNGVEVANVDRFVAEWIAREEKRLQEP